MISKVSSNVTYKQAASVTEFTTQPRTTAGTDWVGVPHSEFLAAVTAEINSRPGLRTIDGFRGHLWFHDLCLVGTVPVKCEFADPDVLPCVGFAANNNWRSPTHYYAGGFVKMDPRDKDFTVPIATYDLRSSHLGHARNVQDEVRTFMDVWVKEVANVGRTVRRLASTKLPTERTNEILLQACRLNLLPWSKLGRWVALYDSSKAKTAWTLYAAFTAVNGLTRPATQMDRMYRLLKTFLLKETAK